MRKSVEYIIKEEESNMMKCLIEIETNSVDSDPRDPVQPRAQRIRLVPHSHEPQITDGAAGAFADTLPRQAKLVMTLQFKKKEGRNYKVWRIDQAATTRAISIQHLLQ